MINSKAIVRRKLGHDIESRLPFAVNSTLNLANF